MYADLTYLSQLYKQKLPGSIFFFCWFLFEMKVPLCLIGWTHDKHPRTYIFKQKHDDLPVQLLLDNQAKPEKEFHKMLQKECKERTY